MARKVFTTPADVSLSKSIDSRLKLYGMAAAAASPVRAGLTPAIGC